MPTFPGVYTQVIDKSYSNGLQSRFTCGLIGLASRGPFNAAVNVRNLADFVANFGASIDSSYLAQAVAAITASGGDGSFVVRVGTQYVDTTAAGSGASGSYAFKTSATNQFAEDDYIRVTQTGKTSTVNARIESITTGTLVLVSAGAEAMALADTYTSAAVEKSAVSGSANQAEAFLTAPTYGAALTAAGAVVGNKNAYTFSVTDASAISVGDVLKITQSGRTTTREIQVTAVNTITNVVTILTTTDTETGRQTLPLQDNYAAGVVYVLSSQTAQVACQLLAATAGTWANTVGNSGLAVTVSPGSAPDTKRFLVFQDGALVETQDNLNFSDSTSDDWFVTRLTGDSYINVGAGNLLSTEPPGNTLDPWNTATYTASNVAAFDDGYNGENVTAADYVGTINPATDDETGLQIFNDKETFGGLFAVAAPGVTSMAVVQMLGLVANAIDAIAIVDVPDNINARDAIDYTNAQGLYANLSRIDNYRVAFFWNWFETLNPFTGVEEFVPPSVGVLGDMVLTFDRYKPWYATAGEQRGQLPNASAVRYPRVREEVKQGMQGGGNVLNPILFYRNQSILIYGDLTTQRTTSKLQAIHTVNLVNYIIKNAAAISRKYVFDPNDSILLSQISLELVTLMETVRSERGVEAYELVCDDTNNTAATRNAKNVYVNLSIIPVDVAERIFLNLTVNASGAVLNAISSGVSI